jgi:hypothetical protein
MFIEESRILWCRPYALGARRAYRRKTKTTFAGNANRGVDVLTGVEIDETKPQHLMRVATSIIPTLMTMAWRIIPLPWRGAECLPQLLMRHLRRQCAHLVLASIIWLLLNFTTHFSRSEILRIRMADETRALRHWPTR